MDSWGNGFKREDTKETDWGLIADEVRYKVTIQDALAMYCPTLTIRNRRCPCPIHNGKDLNFSFTDNLFKCFVCGESGDVITLVKDVLGLSTRADAIRKIGEDFNLWLNLNFHADFSQKDSAKVKELERLRAERERKEREEAEWLERYHTVLDEWIELDNVIRDTPWDSEENIMKVCHAKEKRAQIGYQLDLILASEPHRKR